MPDNKNPKIKAATAIDDFCANVIKPYRDDSVLMPLFHSPYSTVSGNIDQKRTPPAPFPTPIRAKRINSSFKEAIG